MTATRRLLVTTARWARTAKAVSEHREGVRLISSTRTTASPNRDVHRRDPQRPLNVYSGRPRRAPKIRQPPVAWKFP
jgi:hypothetical protein